MIEICPTDPRACIIENNNKNDFLYCDQKSKTCPFSKFTQHAIQRGRLVTEKFFFHSCFLQRRRPLQIEVAGRQWDGPVPNLITSDLCCAMKRFPTPTVKSRAI